MSVEKVKKELRDLCAAIESAERRLQNFQNDLLKREKEGEDTCLTLERIETTLIRLADLKKQRTQKENKLFHDVK